MVEHKEVLRLKALGYSNVQIAESCGCGRNTVTRTLQQAQNKGVTWNDVQHMTAQDVSDVLYPRSPTRSAFRMPDYVQIIQEIHVNNTSTLRAWNTYYEQCIADGQIPYQRSQFYKHFELFQQTLFADHPNDFPGDVMQSGWFPLKTALICPLGTMHHLKRKPFVRINKKKRTGFFSKTGAHSEKCILL